MTAWGRSLGVIAVALGLAGCAEAPPPAPGTMTAEERDEFRHEILSDIDKVESFLQKTQRGVNLSEFTLGWFAMILLSELSAQDAELFDYFHREGGNVESYLRGVFQSDPKAEIITVGALARKGKRPIRQAARHALETLVTIPDPADPAHVQTQSRKDLVSALGRLKASLILVAEEAGPPGP